MKQQSSMEKLRASLQRESFRIARMAVRKIAADDGIPLSDKQELASVMKIADALILVSGNLAEKEVR